MSEKPLCGYCYNECADDCCDKRRIDVLERQLAEARELTVNVLNNMKMILDDDEVAYKRRLDALVRNAEELLNQLKEQGDE